MKRNTLIITGIALLLSIAAVSAFAHGPGWGRDREYGHMMGPNGWGQGWHHRGGYGDDQEGYYGNLSEEEIAKLDQQRSEFFKETETIRQKLNEKELALRSELAKEDPDTSKASRLQSEVSKLQSKLDQKHLAYEIQTRKTVPNNNRNYRGYGPMKGYGSRGGGYCRW
jgi:Spy/CpxP family protein refolding chaperone